jgi:hypothetical protein
MFKCTYRNSSWETSSIVSDINVLERVKLEFFKIEHPSSRFQEAQSRARILPVVPLKASAAAQGCLSWTVGELVDGRGWLPLQL